MTSDEKRPARSYRQASPAPARHRPGARSARRLGPHSFYRRPEEPVMSLTTFFRPRNQPSRRRLLYSRLQVERLEDRTVPSANIDITNGDGIGVETSIDLNPVNPPNLVTVAIHGDLTSAPPVDAAYYSRDGGATWNASGLLPMTLAGLNFPVSVDPTVAFDSRGN